MVETRGDRVRGRSTEKWETVVGRGQMTTRRCRPDGVQDIRLHGVNSQSKGVLVWSVRGLYQDKGVVKIGDMRINERGKGPKWCLESERRRLDATPPLRFVSDLDHNHHLFLLLSSAMTTPPQPSAGPQSLTLLTTSPGAPHRPADASPPVMNGINASPAELRHITSATNLIPSSRERKLSSHNSQHLRTHRLGSRSPASIPSSPTSV